ncbi:hypothetical protein GCM10010277_81100 [Streptomyces longisporoflavus]|uniref:DUF397 domain-containing protein n=1 Tax=Streptomyces longisporoflavus TaxID=28044 RepID=UPI00167CC676|nr:DUF397 domain-containing protein [Streptomyces longisporoflavus]GGV70295.1 hypothetical protein GCM10010277_81100 [Streptomyces longisporoflavus]
MPDLHWQKSSYSSEASNCVELAAASDSTLRLRESDDPTAIVTLRAPALSSLLGAIRQGTFEDHKA